MKTITIAIPIYNEQKNLPDVFSRVDAVASSLPQYKWEFILVDNHSTDSCPTICQAQCNKDARWKYVRFSRNFGIEASFYAGAYYSSGDALIYLFSDLQDPPEKIPEMISHWENGFDVVYGILQNRKDNSILKTFGAHIAYRLIHMLSDIELPVNATDFRLLSRPVVDFLVTSDEKTRYMRGLTHWSGFNQKSFSFERVERKHGKSSAGLWFCIKYALSSALLFSSKPVKLLSIFGLAMTCLSILFSILYVIHLVLTRNGFTYVTPPPPGWTTIVLLIFFFGGINSFFLGIIGEYINQIHKEVKRRPIFIPQRLIGLNKSDIKTGLNVENTVGYV